MNNAHTPQCGKDIEAIVTNLVEIRKEELAEIQSLIGIGLARIAKADNLTHVSGELNYLQQNKTRTEIETPALVCEQEYTCHE